MHASRPLILSFLLAAAATGMAPAALAATAGEGAHDHGAHGAAPQLRLDHGRKWATDAPLREGMSRLRALVAPQLAPAHAGSIGAPAYAELAGKLDIEVGAIVSNCKLSPQADAVLHVILSDLAAGSSAMAGRTPGADRARGLVQVATAVNTYARYFEHRGFTPIAIGH